MFNWLKNLFKKEKPFLELKCEQPTPLPSDPVINQIDKDFIDEYKKPIEIHKTITTKEAKELLDKTVDEVLIITPKDKEKFADKQIKKEVNKETKEERLQRLKEVIKSECFKLSPNETEFRASLSLDYGDFVDLYPPKKTYWETPYRSGYDPMVLGQYKPIADPVMPYSGEVPLFGLNKYRNLIRLGMGKGASVISSQSEFSKPIKNINDLNERITNLNFLINEALNRKIDIYNQGNRASNELLTILKALEKAMDKYIAEKEHNKKLKGIKNA